MIDRRYFRYFDWLSFFLMICLLSVGLSFVFSSTYLPGKPFSLFFKKQMFGIVSGLILYFIACIIDLRHCIRIGYFGFFGILLLLLYTSVAGWVAMGAQRWVNLYVIRFQPSELVKLIFPLFLGFYFSKQHRPSLRLHKQLGFSEFIFPLGAISFKN